MIDKKTFKKIISSPFEKATFKKRGQSWCFDGKDAVVMANLQKSSWDNMYYINVGVWLKGLGTLTNPQPNHCHLDFRVENLFPEKRNLILISCNLDNSNIELLMDLKDFIEEVLIPFLIECTDIEKIKASMQKGIFSNGLVRIEARRYLGND